MLSADGRCAIEVDVVTEKPWYTTARASQIQVQLGAAVVINNCMFDRAVPEGGIATDFSKNAVALELN